MTTAPAPTQAEVGDDIDAVLSFHDGDARAALATLLRDCAHLRQQLSVTEYAMSAGFCRGWRPKYDRD